MIVWIVAFIVGLIVGFAAGIITAAANPDILSEDPSPRAPADDSDPKRLTDSKSQLFQIADTLESTVLQSPVHPRDLLPDTQFQAAVKILVDPGAPLEQVVSYALGGNWVVGIIAAEALAQRTDSQPAVERVLANIGQAAQWPLFFRLRFISARTEQPVIGRVLAAIEPWWGQEPVSVQAIDEFVAERAEAGETLSFGTALDDLMPENIDDIETFVRRLDARRAEPLLKAISDHRAGALDRAFVKSAGSLWSEEIPGTPVFETETLRRTLEEMREALAERPPRSVLLVGEPGVGKTALRRAFSKDLFQQGWKIFETSGANLLSGTRYLGEIETQVNKLIQNACVDKRVALYVERLNELATAGRTRERPLSMLDQLWPQVESHALFMVSEASPEAYQTLQRSYPGLPVTMKVIRISPADEVATAELAQALIAHAQPEAQDSGESVVADALQLSRHYLAHQALPGSTLGLLVLGILRAQRVDEAELIGRDHLLGALSELTGLPPEVLDEHQQLDVEGLRASFQRRVIGQDEAVNCLVERIAMLKAGLTDPNRPIGVFLFAGPTGTGKTEIAKALAELLFGSPEQMLRFDMSEFQTPDSLARLLGQSEHEHESIAPSLVQKIRQQPFSVVLLDEFEKAHANVWDIFLQVFDDGRLTDRQGNLADFRHAIIILTSNLGATISNEAGIGFVGTAGQFSSAEVMRVVNRTFRREFINRLDRVVVFRPLSREIMRGILRKELDKALSRRGFQSKAWAVEWEDSAIEFLLMKGFTPDLGARPLRRAIERYLLAPLSITIVENRAPEGEQFLFVRSDGKTLRVEFIDPDAESETPPEVAVAEASTTPLSVAQLMLHATGAANEQAFLAARVKEIVMRLEDARWRAAKEEGLAEINGDGFWDREDRFQVLHRIELMDRIESASAALDSLAERLRQNGHSPSLTARVAEKLYVLGEGIEDLDGDRPTQGFLGVRLLREDMEHPQALEFLAHIVDMYRQWARRRRMRLTELPVQAGQGPEGVIFSVGGFGSYAILSRESGLHVMESPIDESRFDRVRVRVVVAPQEEPPTPRRDDQIRTARELLNASENQASAVVRRYRELPSPLVRDKVAGWRTGRIDAIWAGNFDVWE